MNGDSRRARRERRGFTAIEVAACITVIAVIIAILLPAMSPCCGSRRPARQLKDSTQVRGIMQAMVIWAGNNNGKFPLPGEIDKDNATIAAEPWAKDTTGNVLSVLIFNGNISTELCVSPAESNTGSIQPCGDYAFMNPPAAADPGKALWDPRFRGTPIDEQVDPRLAGSSGWGHNSYAQLLPFGARRGQWRDNLDPQLPMFGNRGPGYVKDDSGPHGRWTLPEGRTGRGSNTLLIHGGRTTWEGNIGYGDVHVAFETKPTPDGVAYARGAGKKADTPDNLFVNESDEFEGDSTSGSVTKGRNAYVRPIARMAAPEKPVLWVD